ncbi:MAG: hypothetical protein AB1798_12215 [Spirochaetota bacterium]
MMEIINLNLVDQVASMRIHISKWSGPLGKLPCFASVEKATKGLELGFEVIHFRGKNVSLANCGFDEEQ